MENFPAYEIARQSAAYYDLPQPGYLRLQGADRLDFLQRQTTNDLRQLTADGAIATILTSPTARILDLLWVVNAGDTLGVITLPRRSSETAQFLRSRIFFSDQVSVDDVSSEFAQILLLGPQATQVLNRLGGSQLTMGVHTWCEWRAHSAVVVRQGIPVPEGYRILVPIGAKSDLLAALQAAELPPLSPQEFDILRIEAGQPGPVGELVSAYTPLEVQLDAYVSDSKGCYTGQEIIARQVSYDKVAKHLVGIALSAKTEAGATLQVDGKSVGTLTSVAQSPRLGYIGLGVVRRPYHEPGNNLVVVGVESASAREAAVICDLPFS